MPGAIVKDGRVYLRNAETGQAVSVEEHEARDALSTGEFRPETPDEFSRRMIQRERGTVGQQALTVAEGAAGISGGGATLGLAAPIAEAIGGREYIDAVKERAEENPTARTFGDVAGVVGSALATGGGGLLGGAARLTPAGLATRAGLGAERAVGALGAGTGILGTAARVGTAGAVEGAAYGLGGSLAKSVLEDTAWTADRALAGLRDGALYGLAGGAVAGGVGALGGKVVKGMLGGRTLKESAEQFAEKRAVSATIGDDARTVARLTDDGAKPGALKEAAEWLTQKGIPVADHPAAVRALKATRIAEAEAVQVAARNLDTMGAALQVERRAKVAEKLADMAQSGRAGKAAARAIGKELDGAKTFTDAVDLLGSVERQATKAVDTPLEAQLSAVRSQLTDGLTEAAELTSPELAAAFTSSKRSHEIASALHDGAKAEAGRLAAKGPESPFSGMGGSLLGALAGVATGSIGLGAVTGILGGVLQNSARTMIRERGGSALISLANHVAASTARIDGAAKVLAGLKTAPAKAAASAALGGDYATVAASIADANNPEALHAKIERTIAPLARQQPEVAMQMAKQITEDHMWLASQVPAPMGAKESLTPQAEPRPLPKAAKEKLVSYAKALADPVSVVEGMSHGRVDWNGIEALKARRPDMWESMRQSVIVACAQSEKELPYRRKIMLSLAFDFQADASLGNVAAIQASGTLPPADPIPGAGGEGAPPPASGIRAQAIGSAASETEIHSAVGDAA